MPQALHRVAALSVPLGVQPLRHMGVSWGREFGGQASEGSVGRQEAKGFFWPAVACAKSNTRARQARTPPRHALFAHVGAMVWSGAAKAAGGEVVKVESHVWLVRVASYSHAPKRRVRFCCSLRQVDALIFRERRPTSCTLFLLVDFGGQHSTTQDRVFSDVPENRKASPKKKSHSQRLALPTRPRVHDARFHRAAVAHSRWPVHKMSPPVWLV